MKNKTRENNLDNSLKLIAKSSLFVFIGVISSKVLTYIYRVIIARYFGPEVYGLFSLATMILMWLVAFATFGLYEGLLRFVSFYRGKNDNNKIRYTLRISMLTLFFSGILFGVLLFLFSDIISLYLFHDQDLIIFLKIFSFIVPIYVFLYVFLAVIQAFEKINIYTFLLDFLENFLKLILIIFFIFLGFKTNAVIFSYFLGVAIVLIISFIYCKKKIPEIFGKYDLKEKSKKEIRKKLFSYSWPLIFSTLLYVILPYIDSLAIGYFKGVADVGFYNAAVPLAVLLIFAPTLFMRLFFPLVTKEFSRNNTSVISELSKQVEKWIFIVNLPILLLMVIFPGDFLNLLFGAEYLVAENSLRILALGYFFYSMSLLFYNLLSIAGKSKLMLINVIVTSILNLVLNIIFVPKYGINGAAFATMICYIILSGILFLQVKRHTSIMPLRRKMLRVVFSVSISAALLLCIKQFFVTNLLTIILQGSFFILSYLFLIWATRSFDKNDIMILKSIKKKVFKK